MSDWQPIETWNKVSDKTKPILVYFPNWGVEKVKCVFTGYEVFTFGNYIIPIEPLPYENMKGPTRPPTHWMPLPTPPSAS